MKSLDAILATAEKKSLQRSLGALQLTLLGIGAVIGTGIFVLTAEAAQKTGPAMMVSFVIAAAVCCVAALCYAELAAMVPVAGSAYTYTYAVLGEVLAWMVGWALILEYAVGASAVAVGWSGYATGLLQSRLGIHVPHEWAVGPMSGGYANLPAVMIALFVTWFLVIGTRESARLNAILVAVKISALTLFIVVALPHADAQHFHPFMPLGFAGAAGAAASIFFAYVGFDAVSTAAEETRNPQRNVPLALFGSLAVCTIFYLLVAAGVIGSPIGAQPVVGAAGQILAPGTPQLAARCQAIVASGHIEPVPCSSEALAHVMRVMGFPSVGDLIGAAAAMALPSVVLMMMFGQTRIFFVMARDGLLPERLAAIHPRYRTPHVVTMVTGVGVAAAAAFLPVGKLADYSNSGTLFAFATVACAVLALRWIDPSRRRPFRTPALPIVAPAAVAGCLYLYVSLPLTAMLVLPGWGALGLVVYFAYGRGHSHVGRGVTEVPELAIEPSVVQQ